MADQVFLHLVALTTMVIGASAWRCAKYEHYFSQQPDYIDCIWDCCGNSFNRHCCAPIGIIVGCVIVGAVVVAALVVLLICWWQRRRSRQSQGPRLFHNRRHSHYPVAPTSVTRPAMSYGPGPDSGYKPPPPGPGYGPPGGYRPVPQKGYRPPNPEKPPISDFHDDDDDDRRVPPPGGPRPGPPPGGYRPRGPPPNSNNRPPSPDNYPGERAIDI